MKRDKPCWNFIKFDNGEFFGQTFRTKKECIDLIKSFSNIEPVIHSQMVGKDRVFIIRKKAHAYPGDNELYLQ